MYLISSRGPNGWSGLSCLDVHSGKSMNLATSDHVCGGYIKPLRRKLELKSKLPDTDLVKQIGTTEVEIRGGLVGVNPKPVKGLPSIVVDWLEKFVVKLMYDSSQPHHWLCANFAPVDETPPCKDLSVIGHLPECLNGEFVRVGPNPKFPPVAGYHWFDGDGMIHGLRIKDGKPTYLSRYVRTSRLEQEEFFGGAKFVKIGDLKGLFGFLMILMETIRSRLKVLDFSYGNGTGNTALTYHHGKLLALSEGDKPYAIKILEDGDLQTIGLVDYDKRLSHTFTAHPKIDPVTGEMFTFGYSRTPPYVMYRVISKDGVMNDPVQITIPESIMMHDFAITQNFAVFMDLPLYFRPKEMVKNKKFSYIFDATKKARFGILPRYAKNELQIKWFELPTCFIFHNANAWEEGDEVILITCRLQNPNLDMVGGGVKERIDNFTSELYEIRFNMETGAASQKKLSESAVDFPRVNDFYTGRKQRYVYATTLDSIGKVSGIVKFDLDAEPETGKTKVETGGNVRGIYELERGTFGSEAIFVPSRPRVDTEEDDGYLIFFTHNENTGKSSVTVIDAKTMSPDPVAVVPLPHRVPYGFHAFFVTEMIDETGSSTLCLCSCVGQTTMPLASTVDSLWSHYNTSKFDRWMPQSMLDKFKLWHEEQIQEQSKFCFFK